ncbi:hypothetical protein OSJ99_21845, partial [Escherichia coli]|nr:hypothetical protein [Escherichia coli]MDZ3901697.1 hypothetical protein [Escherichia coli]
MTALRSQDIKRTVLYGTVFGLLYEQHDERTDERFSGDTSEVSHFRFNPVGNDSNLLIVFYVQIMPDDFVMQLHR